MIARIKSHAISIIILKLMRGFIQDCHGYCLTLTINFEILVLCPAVVGNDKSLTTINYAEKISWLLYFLKKF